MKQKITLQNTNIYFTPSFLGNGWETSLSPTTERGYQSDFSFPITFSWLKNILMKMQKSGQEKERTNGGEELACARSADRPMSWTSAIVRLFL